jgi:hypothetical protein
MPTMIRKILLLSLALVLALALLGCAEKEETLTPEQIDQIVIDAANALAEAETYAFDMDASETIDVIGGTEPGTMSLAADATGVIDNANKEMQLGMNMTMNVPEEDQQQMGMEIYIVDEWVYVRMSIPEVGEEWMKMELTPEMWGLWEQVDQQVELLETATEVKFVGSEVVNGIQCYVFDIMPDMEQLAEYLAQQQVMLGMGLAEMENLEELLDKTSLSIEEWIAKDSSLLMKAQANMRVEVTPDDVGATPEDFDKMTMDLSMDMTVYDYNQPVSIELPPEALEAPAIPVM